MSFVAIPPASDPAPAVITVGTFWPSIDMNAFSASMRVGATNITDPRRYGALIGAIFTVTNDLTAWQGTQEAAGYATLKNVPSIVIGDETRLTLLWRRAVFSYAAADLIEAHQDITATPAGATRAEESLPTADDHRRNGIHAIRDILGVGRATVELI